MIGKTMLIEKKSISLSVVFILSFFLLSSCKQKDEEKLQEQELTRMIDKEEYYQVLKWFEREENTQTGQNLLVYKAYALMGIGNLVPMEFVLRLREVQSFKEKTLEEFFSHCENIKLGTDLKEANKCFSLRLLNQAPVPEDIHLKQAREVFHSLSSRARLSKQDLILMGFLETTIVLGRMRNVLLSYAKLNPDEVSYEEAKSLFKEVQLAAKDMQTFVGTLTEHKTLLTQKLTGLKEFKLFSESSEGKIEFLESTGFPLFLKVSDINNESGTDMIGRNAIIQVLDQGYDFFSH